MTFSSNRVPPKSSAPNCNAICPVFLPSENHDACIWGMLFRNMRLIAMILIYRFGPASVFTFLPSAVFSRLYDHGINAVNPPWLLF